MKELVGIVEYGCGNIRSVSNAIKSVGADFCLINSKDDFENVSKLILPGVGSFDVAMQSLIDMHLYEEIINFVHTPGNRLLGICLGMQLLCNRSEEGVLPGFGFVDAEVILLNESTSIKVPHMGWSTVIPRRDDTLIDGLNSETDYYFLHSYSVKVNDDRSLLGSTDYGVEFASMVHKDNIWGVQFHPEKSQSSGLKLLKNFIELC